jgi:hypothetical protein
MKNIKVSQRSFRKERKGMSFCNDDFVTSLKKLDEHNKKA